MTNKLKIFTGLVGASVFAIGFGASLKSGAEKVNAAVEFEESVVDVTAASLSAVTAGSRYTIVLWFNGERKPDYDSLATSQTIDTATYATPVTNPVSSYKYGEYMTYNGTPVTLHAGWDNRCQFRKNSQGIMQFVFDFDISTPAAEDRVVFKQGMEIPSFNYIYGNVPAGEKPVKYVLDKSYVFTVATDKITLRALTETYQTTNVEEINYQPVTSSRKYDGYFRFKLTNNDYPIGSTDKNVNLLNSYGTKIKACTSIPTTVDIYNSESVVKHIAADYGSQVFLNEYRTTTDNYPGQFSTRLLSFYKTDESPETVSKIVVKAGTKFVSYSYLKDTAATVSFYYLTESEVTFVLDDASSNGRYISEAKYAEEVAALKTTVKAELDTYNGGASNYTINKTAYDAAIATAKTNIDAATTKTAVNSALAAGKTAIDGIDNDLVATKKNAKADLLSKKNELADDVTFRAEALASAYETAVAAVEAASSIEAVGAAKTSGITAMEAVPTDAEIKSAAKTELEGCYDPTKYVIKQGEIDDIIEAKEEIIDDATSEADVTKAVTDGKADIAKVLSDETIKANAKTEVTSYRGGADAFTFNKTDYEAVIADFDTDIADANTQTLVDKAISDAKDAIDLIPSDEDVKDAAKDELLTKKNELAVEVTFRGENLTSEYNAGVANIEAATSVEAVNSAKTACIAAMEEVPTDAEIKVDAKFELEGCYDPSDYYIRQSDIDQIIAEKEALIDEATTEAAVTAAVNDGKAAISDVPNDETVKSVAQGEVAMYKGGANFFKLNEDDYNAAIVVFNVELGLADSQAKVDEAVANAKEAIDKIPTDAEIKAAANAELDGKYNELKTTRTILSNDLTNALNSAKANVTNATTKAAVQSAVSEGKTKMGEVAEDSVVRSEYIAQVDAKINSVDMTKYSEANQQAIKDLGTKARSDIQSATTAEAMQSIVTKLSEDIAKVSVKSGCGGSIVGTSAIVSLLALAGVGLFLKKRKED